MSNGRDSGQHQDSAWQLLEAIEALSPADGWPDILGNPALNLGVRPMAVPLSNLQTPEIYLGLFARTLDFAVFPHLSGHPPAAAAGLCGREGHGVGLKGKFAKEFVIRSGSAGI